MRTRARMWYVSPCPRDCGASTRRSDRSQVFNLQRLAVLTASLSSSTPDANVIWEAMRDRVHQPWREGLVSCRLRCGD